MSLKIQLGQKIQMLRKKRRLTQEQFAELIGIDPKNVSKIENGNNYPSAETLTSIAKALEVDIYELFVFKEEISYEDMREQIIKALDSDKAVMYLYQAVKLM
ncbi:helix-turn-helix transcriptional regulator [bacterium]|uniref:Helix-turn-helix transcriptional regulator n=1 Tax=Candidatus Scatenecus faecavium TaxID=2840915 RepID=A0A9D1FVU6_9BACT|nr:helix-turn-helix transcriptional regulator [bacterium]HIS82890.1 helix-turn-helix transcriptional regulator [Candidatus Scatenecus faecavium]